MIISLVSFLLFAEAVQETKAPTKLDPLTIRSTLKEQFSSGEDIEFFCIQNSKECYIAKKGTIIQFEGALDLGSNLEVYTIDNNNQLAQIEDFGRVKEQKITLRYTLYANGSTTELILSNDNGVYYLPSYFGETQKVESLESARKLWIKDEYNLKDSANYF